MSLFQHVLHFGNCKYMFQGYIVGRWAFKIQINMLA